MNLLTAMEVTAAGLDAQRTRMNLIASNLANAEATRTAAGGPYRRLDPVLSARPVAQAFPRMLEDKLAGAVHTVEVSAVVADPAPPRRVYDPTHPDADPAGYVAYPNVNRVEEMVNLLSAARAYEAGVALMQTLRAMTDRALAIGR